MSDGFEHITNSSMQVYDALSNSVTHIAAVLQQFQENIAESRKNKRAKKSFDIMHARISS
jgi:hypothetical protein